jgi:hypothetical protein
MSDPQPPNQRQISGILVFTLAALCLLLALAGLARIAYDVIVLGKLSGQLVKVFILALVYAFGLGLGSVSRTRFDDPLFPIFARICAWAYLALTWLSYLGVALIADQHQYSVLQYLAFLFVLAVELVALIGLRVVTSGIPRAAFAIPLLLIVLFQLILIVFHYVFASAPISAYLAGDLLLMLAMGLASSAMLGEDAFRALIERFIAKVG